MKAYEILVNQVIEKLEQWILPWNKPWVWWVPENYISTVPYRWFNKLVLSLNDYEDQRYLTIKQVKKLGWNIKKGSHGTKIFYYISQDREDDENEKNTYCPHIIRYYTVFNIEQVDWIDFIQTKPSNTENNYLCKAQEIVTKYKDKPTIETWLNASYNVLEDIITIPSLYKFKSNTGYFSTLFHEFIHSTWNKSRLWRLWLQEIEYFWSESYTKEELIAELWNMFLCMEAWIINETMENSQSYIAWWLDYIKWNKKDIITASSQAEKAAKYILWNNIPANI